MDGVWKWVIAFLGMGELGKWVTKAGKWHVEMDGGKKEWSEIGHCEMVRKINRKKEGKEKRKNWERKIRKRKKKRGAIRKIKQRKKELEKRKKH